MLRIRNPVYNTCGSNKKTSPQQGDDGVSFEEGGISREANITTEATIRDNEDKNDGSSPICSRMPITDFEKFQLKVCTADYKVGHYRFF
jgi:hypothetical protein